MKTYFFLLNLFFFYSCSPSPSRTAALETPHDSLPTASDTTAQVDDYKTVKNIDHWAEAPYSVETTAKNFALYTKADLHSKRQWIAVTPQNKFGSLYGMSEVGDFYEVHYQLRNDPRTTVQGYVRKGVFRKDSEEVIADLTDLNITRYINVGEQEDTQNNLKKYASISLLSARDYQAAQRNNTPTFKPSKLVKETTKTYQFQTKTGEQTLLKEEVDQEATYTLQLLGYSADLNKLAFLQSNSYNEEVYTMLYSLENNTQDPLAFLGPLVLSPNKRQFIVLNNDNSVGCNLALYSSKTFQNIFFANLSEFKISDAKQVFWLDDHTILAEIVAPNIANLQKIRKEQLSSKQYVKIVLK